MSMWWHAARQTTREYIGGLVEQSMTGDDLVRGCPASDRVDSVGRVVEWRQ
jgi:hypothetical protein